MTDKIVGLSLTVGFLLYLWFTADLSIVNRFKNWWVKVAPKDWAGKPFVCHFCMSFWFSLIVGTALIWYGSVDFSDVLLVVPASVIVGLLVIKTIERLDTIYL